MTTVGEFQKANVDWFSEVIENALPKNADKNKPACTTILSLDRMAALLYSLVSRDTDRVIVDFEDKHLHRWARPVVVGNLLYIAWSESPECASYLKMRPQSMEVFSYPKEPRFNSIRIACLGAAAPVGSIPEDQFATLKYVEAEYDALEEEPIRDFYAAERYCISTVTFPSSVLVHPKGSLWTNKDAKRLFVRDLKEGAVKFPDYFDELYKIMNKQGQKSLTEIM